ncbi:V-set and immunoglobulin domain-containing protein 1 [Pelobates fuscus]|uniref:V-set and immunoglobulin domain-containing protein 1 n=1 Tax=Pelobates fuscus TaxID=191477 RepID=UPI002FE45FFA
MKVFVLIWSFTVVGLVSSVTVTIQNPAINVTVGENVTLYCTYTPAGTITPNLFIQWSVTEAASQETNYVYYFLNGKPNTAGRYVNRVTAANTPGNASITISNLQPADTGLYTCEVTDPPSGPSQGTVRLTVMVAPSAPHCSMRGPMETGHYLSLYCYSEEGMPRPTYTWKRVKNGELTPIPVQTNQKKGILIIGNLTTFDDGYYRCTASNSLGNATCELDLHTGGEAGIIVGGIIGAVLLAAIIFAVIFFLVTKKKKNKKQLPAASEMKAVPSAEPHAYQAVPNVARDPASENLVESEPSGTIEFHDHAGNVASANGEMENPSA